MVNPTVFVTILSLLTHSNSIATIRAFNVKNIGRIHQLQSLTRQQLKYQQRGISSRYGRRTAQISTLFMSTSTPDFNSNDPFRVLGMDNPTSNKKEIKRAYKRMALKFHPDVITNKDSSDDEKKKASDRFAKINWAYEMLSGKNSGGVGAGAGPSSSSTSSSTSGGWTPPHRRQGSYSGSSGRSGNYNDWTDYAPKYDDSQYDAGGDSFGKIFSDLFTGAAGAAMSGGSGAGVFKDFVEFLENNVDGYTGGVGSGVGGSDDAELRILLTTGTLEDVANEMDDTELVVQSLSTKLNNIQDELIMLKEEIKITGISYREKIDLSTRIEELEAKQRVTNNYRKKSQERLVKLQTRYKELIVSGKNDSYAGARSSTYSSSDNYSNRSGGGYGGSDNSSRSSYSTSSNTGTSSGSSSSYSSSRSKDDGDESWKSEGFGSYGRGRGSSRRGSASSRRRRQQQRQTTTASSSSDTSRGSYSTSSSSDRFSSRRADTSSTDNFYGQRPPRSSSSYSSTPSSTTSSSSSTSSSSPSSTSYVPPHRRTTGDSFERQAEADKRRLRELQIDDEFDKLKKELGL